MLQKQTRKTEKRDAQLIYTQNPSLFTRVRVRPQC